MYNFRQINVPYYILPCNSSTHQTSAFLSLPNYSRTNWYSCLTCCLFARCVKRQFLLKNATISFRANIIYLRAEQWFVVSCFVLVRLFFGFYFESTASVKRIKATLSIIAPKWKISFSSSDFSEQFLLSYL